MLFYDSLDILAEFLELLSLAIETRIQCKCCEFIDANNYSAFIYVLFMRSPRNLSIRSIIRLVTQR